MRIKSLGKQLANQIAAGEVVERPASVVKELIENSIDAGATSIKINIESGGKQLIQIIDNGLGIDKSDLSLAVSRHATSKISSLSDLEYVQSLGFRGEALASISSISRLALQSFYHKSDDQKGWGIDTSDESDFANYEAEVIPASIMKGTMVTVRDLFFNTPARRKFLRTDKTEFRYIEGIFKQLSIGHPELSFELIHNSKRIKKVGKAVNEEEELRRLQKLVSIDFCHFSHVINLVSQNLPNIGQLSLRGWVADKRYTRTQADQQFFYVNGRYVKDKLLSHALRQAFQEFFSINEYVAFVLFLTLDPEQVDVNVHPTKHEVRFHYSRIIHDFIVSALMQAFTLPISQADTNPLFSDKKLSSDVVNRVVNGVVSEVASDISNETDDLYSNKVNNQKITVCSESEHSQYEVIEPPIYQENAQAITHTLNHSHISFKARQKIEMPSVSGTSISEGDVINGKQNKVKLDSPETDISTFLSTAGGKFLLTQVNDFLYVIDSIKMSQSINRLELSEHFPIEGEIESHSQSIKTLLIPEVIIFRPADIEQISRHQATLSQFGIDFSLASEESILLRRIPRLTFNLDVQDLFKNIVSLLKSFKSDNLLIEEVKQLAQVISASIDLTDQEQTHHQLKILKAINENNITTHFNSCVKKISAKDLSNYFS